MRVFFMKMNGFQPKINLYRGFRMDRFQQRSWQQKDLRGVHIINKKKSANFFYRDICIQISAEYSVKFTHTNTKCIRKKYFSYFCSPKKKGGMLLGKCLLDTHIIVLV